MAATYSFIILNSYLVGSIHAHKNAVQKMAVMLNYWTIEEQCALVQFLWAKGLVSKNIRIEMFITWNSPQLGGKIFTGPFQSCSWRSKQPSSFDCAKINWTTGGRIDLGWSKSDNWRHHNGNNMFLFFNTQHSHLNIRKVCTCSVPCQLTEKHKKNWMGIC